MASPMLPSRNEHVALPELLAEKESLRVSLLMAQGKWNAAYPLVQARLDEAAQTENHLLHVKALLEAARIAAHTGSPAPALGFLDEAEAIAAHSGLAGEMNHSIEMNYSTGIVTFALGDMVEAEQRFLAVARAIRSRPLELFALRWIIGVIFYLARVRQQALAPELFARAVVLAATQPQTGFMTRMDAQRLAVAEGLSFDDREDQARSPVPWLEECLSGSNWSC